MEKVFQIKNEVFSISYQSVLIYIYPIRKIYFLIIWHMIYFH